VLRIAFDHQIFAAQTVGGVSRYFVELARTFARDPGVSIRIHAPMHVNRYLAGADRFGSGARLWPFPGVTRLSNGVARIWPVQGPCDVLHQTYYARPTARARGRALATTVHDLIAERGLLDTDAMRGDPHAKLRAARAADHVFCVSECTRQDLLELGGVDPDRMTVTPHASTLQALDPVPVAIDRPYFLHVGRRRGYKNFPTLLDAYCAARDLAQSHALVSVTADALAPDDRVRVERAGGRLVHVRAGDRQLAWLYRHARALVFPSLAEGFGLPVLEAMACACPVIAADIPVMREVAGNDATLVSGNDAGAYAEAMRRAAGDPGWRATRIAGGLARSAGFTWARCAELTLSGYRLALQR